MYSQLPSVTGGHSSTRNLRTHHAMVTGTHLTRVLATSGIHIEHGALKCWCKPKPHESYINSLSQTKSRAKPFSIMFPSHRNLYPAIIACPSVRSSNISLHDLQIGITRAREMLCCGSWRITVRLRRFWLKSDQYVDTSGEEDLCTSRSAFSVLIGLLRDILNALRPLRTWISGRCSHCFCVVFVCYN
jgi:hypothetical protein